ncbi:MAG: prolipoprotein diacylglyceryl transferase [Microbacteriaceae bacterium]|nr:prolipoprotein diacylglyceryl transferase [Microbacteriaceae bacterium]HEV7957332.1 prolipoprotein diacylglyceryl transferase [Marisediminicola sp.]
MFAPLSIPSPSYDLQVFDLGQWLRDIGLSWFPFNINIHAYALCILLGILAAGILTNHRLNRRGAEPGIVIDVSIWAVVFGIIGARTFHVLTHPDDYFGQGRDLIRVFFVWEGGIAIFGALLGGALGAYIGCRLIGLRFWTYADALAPGLLLAQAMGRLGNYFNHELYGLPTNLPWGLEIESTNPAFPAGLPDGTLFHPTFLYEIIWNLAGVAVLLLAERRFKRSRAEIAGATVPTLEAVSYRLQWGKLLGLYLIWYGLGRSAFESLRIDPSEIFLGVRTNVWAAFAAILVGVIIIIVQGRRHPGIEPSPYRPGRGWAPEAALDSEDTYSDGDSDGAATATESDAASVPATSGTGGTGPGTKVLGAKR